MTYGLLRSEELREIRQKVLYGNKDAPQQTQSSFIYTDEFYGVLNADLAAATNPLTGHTSVNVTVLRYIDITVNTNMELSTTVISGVNRSESLTGARGTLCLLKYIGAEYVFKWIDCEVSTTLLNALP